jgi:hypothetical protein
MSYLDLPRFHILGTFYTDPPTANNDPSHYDPDCTIPSPWQDPNGTHSFKFLNVSVASAMDASGNLITSNDPLISASVSSVDQPTAARLVDLDVYQQDPQIWGFQLQIPIGSGALAGTIDVPSLNSLRFTRVLPTRGWEAWDEYGWSSFGGDTDAVGVFQSVLRVPQTKWPTGSPILDQLRSAATLDSSGNVMVSFRMVLDGYINVASHQAFRTGRILATLGPVRNAAEPAQAPGGRWLSARRLRTMQDVPPPTPAEAAKWYWPSLYDAPFQFAQRAGGVQTIVIDLANALATTTPAGPVVDLGDLTVQIGDGTAGPIGPFQCNDSLYTDLGGIIEIPVSAQQFAARKAPVRISSSLADIGGPVLWSENPTGLYFTAEERILRMTSEPDSAQRTANSRVYVTQWGEPAAGIQLGVETVSVVNGDKMATVPWSGGYQGNTKQADGALVSSVSASGADGWATVKYEVVKDPGSRTPQLDGQLYFVVVYNPAAGPPPDLSKQGCAQEQMVSVVAMSSYPVNENPTWEEVQAMMVPYAKLYPAMTTYIKLDDFHAFQIFATNPPWANAHYGPANYTLPNGKTISSGAVPFYLTRPLNDPRRMPITRDLSPNKVLTVLYFIYNLIQKMQQPGETS